MSRTPSIIPSCADAFRTTLDLFDTGLDLMCQAGEVIPRRATRKSSGCFASGFWTAQERSLAIVLAGSST